MTSYRSKSTTWSKGDKVTAAQFETVEDNADTACQTLDARTFVDSIHVGDDNITFQLATAGDERRITNSGAVLQLTFGTCTTGEKLMAWATFPAHVQGMPNIFSMKFNASGGSTNRTSTLYVNSGGTKIISHVGTHTVTSGDSGKIHYAALYVETSTSGTTTIVGKVNMAGQKWRAVS